MENDLHPIAILVDELRSEDVRLRLNSIERINSIGLALGQERTRDELLPFLLESLDDDDEILLALANELGNNFVEYVGGPEYAHLILVVLESLAAVEETLVREKAAESITKLSSVLSPQQIQDYYVPLLKRLSTGDWFTSRTSATALFAAGYTQANPKTQEELRSLFNTLCSDDTPMVRRAAAKELGGFSKTLAHEDLINDLLPTFKKLAQDDQDSVRLLTVDALIAIAEALSDEECKTYCGATMKAMVSDKSWRVRYMVADHFVKLATAAGQDIVREELVVAFVLLLKDIEAEVRTAAAGQIPGSFSFYQIVLGFR
jgi:serine/threonine-protein phosphatase 2A regulatory subunit A